MNEIEFHVDGIIVKISRDDLAFNPVPKKTTDTERITVKPIKLTALKKKELREKIQKRVKWAQVCEPIFISWDEMKESQILSMSQRLNKEFPKKRWWTGKWVQDGVEGTLICRFI